MSRTIVLSFVLCLSAVHLPAQVAPAPADDLNTFFKPVKWRSIGPFRGGRSNASTGVVGDPKTYYMGTTGGGLWKTDDMEIGEHTSELQSLAYLVCRLLLEKKNKNIVK